MKPLPHKGTGAHVAAMKDALELRKRRDEVKRELDWHNEMLGRLQAEEDAGRPVGDSVVMTK